MNIDTNSEEYKSLMAEDKETLVRVVMQLQKIRKGQARRLEEQERELNIYQDIYLDQMLAGLPD